MSHVRRTASAEHPDVLRRLVRPDAVELLRPVRGEDDHRHPRVMRLEDRRVEVRDGGGRRVVTTTAGEPDAFAIPEGEEAGRALVDPHP